MLKQCSRCKTERPLTDFYNRKNRKGGHHSWCRFCMSETSGAWRKANRAKVNTSRQKWNALNPTKDVDYRLKRLYGFGVQEREAMILAQGGKCACCGTQSVGKKGTLFFDHCHLTGQVRGLICASCNCAIGYLRDSVENAQSVVQYLARTSSVESYVAAMAHDEISAETRDHVERVLARAA